MKKKIYEFFVYISLLLIGIGIKLNSYQLCALIIYLNIRKSKEVAYNHKNKKKILVFPKSGGYEDLIEAYYNKKNNDITFYLLPRTFLKKIYSAYFNKNYEKDYYTKLNKRSDNNKKNQYIDFVSSTFREIQKFLSFDGFISFNLFYFAEKYLEEVCLVLNIRYIVLHKESAFTPLEEKNAPSIYQKFNDKSLAYKISVYSESQKKILIQSKIATKNQITINGNPRCDYAFRLRKIKPKKNIIVFYLIETYRNTNYLVNDSKKNWNKIFNMTLRYLIEFIKKNPQTHLIFKGKTGVHEKLVSWFKNLPKNCTFICGGSGERLLRDATVVIAFNSTIVFETIASNRNLIIPNFNNESVTKKDILHKINNKSYLVNSKNLFYKKMKMYLNMKYENKNLSKTDIKTLRYYVGNIDGKSGIKIQKFLNNILKN